MDLEIRTIGALLSIGDHKKHLIQQSMMELSEDCFYSHDTRDIYLIIRKLFDKQEHFDVISILALIPDNRFEFFQRTLRDEFYTANFLTHDIEQLNNYRTLRKQLLILQATLDSAIDENSPSIALNLISDSLSALTETVNVTKNQNKESVQTMVDEWFSQEEDNNYIYLEDTQFPRVPNQSLITIAGRSGHGKTFIAMYLMDKIIDQLPGKQNIYFNLEMNKHVMLQRYAGLLGYTGGTDREIVQNALPELLKKNMYFVNLPMITIDQIETISRLSALSQPVGVMVVDYLGLITTKSKAERNDLDQSGIAKRLAALSIELNCVVIALIQVNRDFKNRPVGERIPRPEDSSESMGSVHSATWWLGIDQPQKDDPSIEYKDLFQLGCRKGRNGETFFFDLDFRDGQFFKRDNKSYQSSISNTDRIHHFSPFKD
jgi:replicative DNA helicase